MLLQYFGLHMDTKEAIATEALLVAFAVFVLSTAVLYFLIPVLLLPLLGVGLSDDFDVWGKFFGFWGKNRGFGSAFA